jgi:hypothetical protein
MTKASHRLASVLHLLGAGRRARLDASQGTGASVAADGTVESVASVSKKRELKIGEGRAKRRSAVGPRAAHFVGIATAACLAFPGIASAAGPPETPSLEYTSRTSTEVSLRGVLSPNVVSEAGTYEFLYKKSPSECEGGSHSTQGLALAVQGQEVLETLKGLEPGAQYTVCLLVENAAHEKAHGGPVTFPLVPEVPLTLSPAQAVASSTAVLEGTLNPGAEGKAGWHFAYSNPGGSSCTEGPTTAQQPEVEGKGLTEKEKVTGLLPNTTYRFCLVATNEVGEAVPASNEVSFTTLIAPPSFSEVSVTKVAATSATLQADINPEGAETSYVFEYAPAGGAFNPVVEPKGHGSGTLPEGTSPVLVQVHLQEGLEPNTTYEFQLVATHSGKEEVTSEPAWFRTQGAGSFTLADGRQWELVSPPDKHGALIYPLGELEHLTASSPAGTAVTYAADAPTEAGPAGSSGLVQVLSTRTSAGWSSRDLVAEHANNPTGTVPYYGTAEYPLFSEDLSQATLAPKGAFAPSLSPEASEQTPYLRTNFFNGNVAEPCASSCYRPLVTGKPGYANVPAGTEFGITLSRSGENLRCPPEAGCGPELLGATSDMSHVVFTSGVALQAGAPSVSLFGGEVPLYEWSAASGALALVSVGPNGEPLLAQGLGDPENRSVRHAISPDGSRVIFTVNSSGVVGHERLYLRDTVRKETIEIGGEGAFFQLASSDTTKVFYKEGNNVEKVEGDLHEFVLTSGPGQPLAGEEQPDLTPGAGVQGRQIIGGSEDGSYLYFVANGMLAPGAVAGNCRHAVANPGLEPEQYREELEAQACNLYLRHGGTTLLVAVLSGADLPDWGGTSNVQLTGMTSRVSPDGQWLAFMSQRPLTGYDSNDAKTGRPDEEVYLYHAGAAGASSLVCASCDPTGARPNAIEFGKIGLHGRDGFEPKWQENQGLAGSVPVWQQTINGFQARYQSRYLTDNGRLFFNASDSLVPADINGTTDVYEYEPQGVGNCTTATSAASDLYVAELDHHAVEGCVGLISSGTSPVESAFLDASSSGGREGDEHEGGGDVFFLTAGKLAPQDFDNSYDVYDAHECTSVAPCSPAPAQPPLPCTTADACRAAQTPQPGVFGAPPSATFAGPGDLAPPPAVVPKKVTTKTVKCRKGFVKKKNKCVKSKQKKKTSNKRGAKR